MQRRRFSFFAMAVAGAWQTSAFSADWICREAASVRQGDTILACGIGLGKSEADARIDALKQAKREFEEICRASSDCRGHELTLDPLRNDCESDPKSGYKCYRGIRVALGSAVNESSFLEQQKKFLDEEIVLTENRLRELQEIREKQQKLDRLRRQVADGVNGKDAAEWEPPKNNETDSEREIDRVNLRIAEKNKRVAQVLKKARCGITFPELIRALGQPDRNESSLYRIIDFWGTYRVEGFPSDSVVTEIIEKNGSGTSRQICRDT
jgi:hypothetical protein